MPTHLQTFTLSSIISQNLRPVDKEFGYNQIEKRKSRTYRADIGPCGDYSHACQMVIRHGGGWLLDAPVSATRCLSNVYWQPKGEV